MSFASKTRHFAKRTAESSNTLGAASHQTFIPCACKREKTKRNNNSASANTHRARFSVGLSVQSLWFRLQGLGFTVNGFESIASCLEIRFQGLLLRVQCVASRVWSLLPAAQGLGFRVQGLLTCTSSSGATQGSGFAPFFVRPRKETIGLFVCLFCFLFGLQIQKSMNKWVLQGR